MENDDLIHIFRQVTVDDFCHIEVDSKIPDDRLYCFKLFFKYADIMDDDILERIAEEEVLIKFNSEKKQERNYLLWRYIILMILKIHGHGYGERINWLIDLFGIMRMIWIKNF